MFILWGIGKKKKETKYTVNDVCGCCKTASVMKIIKIFNYFSIFFLPIISWGTKYYVECPKCGAAREMTKQEYKSIKQQLKENSSKNVVENQPQPVILETAAVEQVTVMEKLIWQDIDKVIYSLKDKSIIKDNEKFNKFLSTLKTSLLNKYGDEIRISKTINKYFNI